MHDVDEGRALTNLLLLLYDCTDLVELAGEGHEEKRQLKHYRHDQRDEEQVVIVVERRAHVDVACLTAC